MLVRERMSTHPVSIAPNTSLPDAISLMREKKVRRLPVLDSQQRLVGIVSDKDLLYASPSPATSLSVWEMHTLLNKLTVDKVMTPDVITVAEDTPIEEAARIMADRRIGGLPVMRRGEMVGIITETDLFRTFVQLLGGRRPGVRLTATTSGVKGTVAKIVNAIFGIGGSIVGLGFSEAPSAAGPLWELTVKVQDVATDKLLEAVRPVVNEILDVREI
jgi:acetoin utilization protein AcuB